MPSAIDSQSPIAEPEQSQNKAIRRYLRIFIAETEAALTESLLLQSKEASDVEPQSLPQLQALRFVSHSTPLPRRRRQGKTPARESRQKIFDDFAEAFVKQESRVLLLGTPGAGKTTTLLQLACNAARACLNTLVTPPLPESPKPPIPIFQNIHRWDQKTALARWVKTSLLSEFPEISWEELPLLYVFDGMEELGKEQPSFHDEPETEKFDLRLSFLQAVETELKNASVVVSCSEEVAIKWDDATVVLSHKGPVFRQDRAKSTLKRTTLLPLKQEQAELFLQARNQIPLGYLAASDPNLLETLRTPLLLTLFSLAVEEAFEQALESGEVQTTEDIFDLYIRQRFIQEARKRALPFTEQETRLRLGILAADRWSDYNPPHQSLKPPLTLEDSEILLGVGYQDFISFACSLQFLRVRSREVAFIHHTFRDYCAVTLHRQALRSKDYRERWAAVDALGQTGGKDAVPILTRALRDENSTVRWASVYALAQAGGTTNAPHLIESLRETNNDIWKAAINVLGRMEEAVVVPLLIQALHDEDHQLRAGAAEALGRTGSQNAVQPLLNAIREESDRIRFQALEAHVGSDEGEEEGEYKDTNRAFFTNPFDGRTVSTSDRQTRQEPQTGCEDPPWHDRERRWHANQTNPSNGYCHAPHCYAPDSEETPQEQISFSRRAGDSGQSRQHVRARH